MLPQSMQAAFVAVFAEVSEHEICIEPPIESFESALEQNPRTGEVTFPKSAKPNPAYLGDSKKFASTAAGFMPAFSPLR
jgi:hypothetical protein